MAIDARTEDEEIDKILADAQKRIRRHGTQEMQILSTNMLALAEQHALTPCKIGFSSPHLRLLPNSFGYGEEPTVNVLTPFKPGVVGEGTRVIYPEKIGDTTLPAHDYQVARIITPNIIVSPPAAAKLFSNDQMVAGTFQQIRQGFVDNVRDSIIRAKTKLYGSANVIPYDVIGSMTLINKPTLFTWRNLPGDLLCFRADLYIGLTIIPGRAISADEDEQEGGEG